MTPSAHRDQARDEKKKGGRRGKYINEGGDGLEKTEITRGTFEGKSWKKNEE